MNAEPAIDSQRADAALPWSTIPELLAARAAAAEAAPVLVDGDTVLDAVELQRRVRAVARGLIALGVQHGDRVGIQAPNGWRWVVAGLAIHSVGGVLIPLNTRYKGHETAWILGRAGARLLFTVTDFLGTDYLEALQGAAGPSAEGRPVRELAELRHVVAMDAEGRADAVGWEALQAQGASVSEAEALRRAAEVGPDDLSDLLFTSGTTGSPRGVMTTHAQNLRVFWTWAQTVGLQAGDRYLIVNPFFHAFGYKAGWLAALMAGATIYPQAVFDVAEVMERVRRDRITVLPGPPALYQSILASADLAAYDLSSLRLAVTGAASIPVSLIERMWSELHFQTVLTAYGLTECCGVATMCRQGDDATTIAQTSGRAIDGVEVRIVDDEGTELPRGEAGEIVIRGFNVMKGYFDEPEKTEETLLNGWLHTGDVGVMDEQGNIRITDRKKDMFIVGGFNAYPAEIENALLERPEIAHVAVVGVPDERLGEVGAAFVVLREGASLSAEELHAWSRERMANYKVPRSWHFVEDLPRNATGKVQKFLLREGLGG